MTTSALTITDLWRDVLERKPEERYLFLPDPESARQRAFRFSSFFKRAARIGVGLASELKLAEGSRVVILCESVNDLSLLVNGMWLARLVALPITLDLSDEMIAMLINNSEASAVVFSLEAAARVAGLIAQTPRVKNWILSGSMNARFPGADIRVLDEIVAGAAGAEDDLPQGGDCDALIALTRSADESPRGVLFSHSQLVSSLKMCAATPLFSNLQAANAENPPILWSLLPQKSLATLSYGLALPLVSDIATILSADTSTREFWTIAQINAATLVLMDQAQLRTILSRGRSKRWVKPANLRVLLIPSGPVTPDLIASFEEQFQVPVAVAYYVTEAGGIVTLAEQTGAERTRGVFESPRDFVNCGTPLKDVDLRVVSPDGRALRPGEIGTVVIHSPAAMTGYCATKPGEAFIGDGGSLHTGDYGIISSARRDDFSFKIVGRVRNFITHHGQTVNLSVVEAALHQIRGVKFAYAVAFRHPSMGISIGAFVMPFRIATLTETDIAAALTHVLRPYELPDAILFGKTGTTERERPTRASIVRKFMKEASSISSKAR